MATWATQRKVTYATVVIVLIVVFVAIPTAIKLYKPPACTDGIKNGTEEGIDCGGVCPRLCQSAFLPPSVQWTKIENVATGLYNVAAYIINPNPNGAALNVPYTYSLFDKDGGLIISTKGVTTLPPHRNTVAFLGAVDTAKRTPVKAIFEFSSTPQWQKSHDTLGDLAILDKKYTEDANSSSLEVTLENRSLTPYTDVYVFVVLYDENNNALGFSKTKIDSIPAGTKTIAPFTWPVSREGKVVSIEVLPVIPPAID